MIEDIVNLLTTMQLLENTYMFFTSDNGFHLGKIGLKFFVIKHSRKDAYSFSLQVSRRCCHHIMVSLEYLPYYWKLFNQTLAFIYLGVEKKFFLHA